MNSLSKSYVYAVLLLLSSILLLGAAEKEKSNITKAKTSPLLNIVTGGQKPLQEIILDYLAVPGEFIVSKTINTQAPVTSLSFNPDDNSFASGGDPNGQIFIWDAETGKLRNRYLAHTAKVNSVAYSKDGKFIASGSEDKTVKIWDLSQKKVVRTFNKHTDAVNVVAYSPHGSYLASGSSDNNIYVQDIKTGKIINTLTNVGGPVDSLIYIYLMQGYDQNIDMQVVLYPTRQKLMVLDPGYQNFQSGIQRYPLDIETFTSKPTALAYNERDQLAIAYIDEKDSVLEGMLVLFDESTNQESRFKAHDNEIHALAYSPDHKYIASASADKTVKLWDTKPSDLNYGIPIDTLEHESPVLSVVYSPDGSVITGSADGKIRIWKRQDIAMGEAEEVTEQD